MKKTFLLFIALATAIVVKPQADTRTLFTVGSNKVSVDQFVYVYNKNAATKHDYSEKALRQYLELYENFLLKLEEAEELHLDTTNSIKSEIEGYRKQLAKGFLTNNVVLDNIIKDAYDRSLKEVNASHILIRCNKDALPADTLLAFRKIMALKKRIDGGESFEKIANENSEDPTAKNNKGIIGWFTVFGTVYEFENAAYALNTGQISTKPVRTEFGYHLVKVNDTRPARGKIHVAHLLLRFPENAPQKEKDDIEKKIYEIYEQIKNGTLAFKDAVESFSDDKASRAKAGELQWFGSGTSIRMVPEFEDAAFALERDNDISMPVQTQFGWHIIKRLEKKGMPSFEESKADIKKRVEKDSRSQLAKLAGVDENNLEQSNEEFKLLLKEYRDGILLFELMDRKVWTKAAKDKDGRYAFYLDRKNKYSNGYSKDSAIVIGDYQEHLEKEWLVQLRKTYHVTVDEAVFASLINKPRVVSLAQAASSNTKQTIKTLPPVLEIKNILFTDGSGNKRIDANESCLLTFEVVNTGKGPADKLKVIFKVDKVSGLRAEQFESIVTIAAGATKKVTIPLTSTTDITTGNASLQVSFEESRGFVPDPFELTIATREFLKPQVKVVDYSFLSDAGKIKLGVPVQLKCIIQNLGQGDAENVKVEFVLPENVFPNGEQAFVLGSLPSGTSKDVVFDFLPNKLYKQTSITIKAVVKEKYGKYAIDKNCTGQVDEATKGTTIAVTSNEKDSPSEPRNIQVASLSSDVDKNIPVNATVNEHRYALIIGNEDYSSYQPGLAKEVNVDFAINDARVFKEYCTKTLGIPEKQIKLLTNATTGQMNQGIAWLTNLARVDNGNAELIVYYSGHGLPDDATKEPYLIPVDVSGTNVAQGIALNAVYARLNESPSQRVTVFLDACFSGGARNQGLVAMKGVKVKPKDNLLSGKMVVFASSTGEESSGVYREKQHGYMTYYLLKILQESRGELNYAQLADYIAQNVKKETALNGKLQTPQVSYSTTVESIWGLWKVK